MKKVCILLMLLCVPVLCSSCFAGDLMELYYKTAYSGYPKYEITKISEEYSFVVHQAEIDGIMYVNAEHYAWKPYYKQQQIIGLSDYYGTTIVYETMSPWCYSLENAASHPFMSSIPHPNALLYNAEVSDEAREMWNETDLTDISLIAYSYLPHYSVHREVDITKPIFVEAEADVTSLHDILTIPDPSTIGTLYIHRTDDNIIRDGELYVFSDEKYLLGLNLHSTILLDTATNKLYIERRKGDHSYLVEVTDLIIR